MKLKNKIIKFMSGRYGVDELYKFLFILYIITLLINIFLNSVLIEIIGLILVLIIFYRVFSKNISKRYKENKEYLKMKDKALKPYKNIKRNIHDKEHIYKKCPKCKTTLKLPIPYERGIKHANCPKCQKRVSLLILKKQKIEIIKNKK